MLRAGRAAARQVYELTGIDPWFLDQILLINEVADETAHAPAR